MYTIPSLKRFLIMGLLASSMSCTATHYDITDETLAQLAAPFSSLTLATLRSAKYYGQDQLYTSYKRDIINLQIVGTLLLSTFTGANYTVIEIGCGSGATTRQLLKRLYEASPTSNLSNARLIAVDDFRPRSGEVGLRGGAIDIPERVAFHSTALDTQYTGDDAFLQFLSNLVHTEAATTDAPNSLLEKVIIARKTTAFLGGTGATRTDADLIAGPSPEDLYTITPNGAINPLEEIIASAQVSHTGRSAAILIDTDPASSAEMFNTLKCAWNVLADYGTLIIDDVSWQNKGAADPTARPVREGLALFLQLLHPEVDFFTTDDYVRIHSYDGKNPTPTSTHNGNNLIISRELEEVGAPPEPRLTFHNIWPGRGRWIAVLARGSFENDADVDLTAPEPTTPLNPDPID